MQGKNQNVSLELKVMKIIRPNIILEPESAFGWDTPLLKLFVVFNIAFAGFNAGVKMVADG